MIARNFFVATALSCATFALADVKPAILFSQEPCKGKSLDIKADNGCVLLPVDLRKNINGADLPTDVVCNFFTDEKCDNPLYIGMEDPGTCFFSDPDVDIANKTVSVQCYDSNSIYDQREAL
ncbi:hypothetical protein PEBR_16014 [Penicillium brasilianum]|uniref:Uncharacterized protein n=1 Tax=Penicillium brasilianum TaxID=104259 RepID=A0A1S9RQ81_PENBI|nr:hypothetical protein PEBR_16014 [Penicillium brasilianum]